MKWVKRLILMNVLEKEKVIVLVKIEFWKINLLKINLITS